MTENIIFTQQVRDQANTTLDVLLTNLGTAANLGANAANTVTITANNGSLFTANQLNFVNTANISVAITAGAAGIANIAITGAASVPGGSNTWVQFNDAGIFGGTANVLYNKANNTVVVNGTMILNSSNVTALLAAIYAQANTQGTYANGSIIVANTANLNFNNTGSVNVSVTSNGTQSNIAFSVNTSILASGSGSITDYSSPATANQTVFTMTGNVSSASYVIVSKNGVLMIPGIHYTITSNNILTFTSNCSLNDSIDARIFSTGVSAGVIGTPGGANTWVQFNDSGVLGGVTSFTFDKSSNTVNVSNGSVLIGGIDVANTLAAAYAKANSAANTVSVSANNAGALPARKLNFNNTSSTLVSVQDVGNGNANISFIGQVIIVQGLSDLNTALTTGQTKAYMRSPKAFTLANVRGSLVTSSSSGNVTVQIRNNGANILSTVLSVSQGSNTSFGGNSVAAVVSSPVIADNDLLQFDIVSAGTGATGLVVTLLGNG